MKILYNLILLLCLCGSLTSCIDEDAGPPDSVEGFAPIYLAKTDSDTVTFIQPQPTVQPGKIVIKGTLLFQVEQYQGIHIVDLSDPENAKKIGFYKIFACSELTIHNHFIYTNSGRDFIVIDIKQLDVPRVTDYRDNYFTAFSFPAPPVNSYFECPDPTKGIIIGWEAKTLNNPQCKY
ncbi:MAG: hypothetical protein J5I59_00115 [Saprospiraceae bacterium]|nr:hypothetical protein [Saprospiraceae bacterium]